MAAITETPHDAYNRIAIDTAQKLTAARAAAFAASNATARPREQRFPAFDPTALGVAREWARMGARPVSESLEARARDAGFEFEHLGLTIGTIIHGIDLKAALAPELVALVRDTLLERKVVCFRDQHLDEAQQVAFSRQFGELDAFPFGKPGEDPYIVEISHDEHRPGTENLWHTDVTWMEEPSLGSIAQCIEVPPVGGDTLFSDSHAALLGLPAEVREQIEGVSAVHDYRVFLAGALPADLVDEIKSDIPFGVVHPLVRTHPETGKSGLYLHGGFIRHDSLHDSKTGTPLDPETSRAIVARLLQQHARPEYVCRFRWEPGSIAFWDNRAAQHYAASDYYPHHRVLRRVTIAGDRPFFDPEQAAATEPPAL